jgi:hypothetical protein
LARPQSKTRRVHPCLSNLPIRSSAQRKDLCLAAPPTLKGATAQKVASKLISAGFVKEVKAKASDPIWRRDEGASYALKLTAAGAKAIAVDDAAEPEDADEEGDALGNRNQATVLSKLDAKDAPPAEAMEPGPIRPCAPRGGSKLAQVIELLHRDHGATIEELIAATGWLAHTTRAALTGLRKRGYVVSIDRSDDKRGSFYRIPACETGLVEAPTTARRGRRPASPDPSPGWRRTGCHDPNEGAQFGDVSTPRYFQSVEGDSIPGGRIVEVHKT